MAAQQVRVAVLSLTRDRLAYSQYCFQTLRANAGCDYDHFVLDNASTDGTFEWLMDEFDEHLTGLAASPRNVGICRALNRMLDEFELSEHDVIVRFDNDCEVTQPDTLKTVCEVALEHDAIVAPRVLGLQAPPLTLCNTQLGDQVLEETAILGGIFMAIPATLFFEHGFRYDESMPPYTGDEAIVPWWRSRGGRAGYLQGWHVNHYLTSVGQRSDGRVAEYEKRKLAEMRR